MEDRHFFNPFGDVRHTKNRLPHWQQQGAAYFVTFRLADAIPRRLQDQWQNEREVWLNAHPDPWSGETELEYLKRFSGALERWLDAGHGSRLLRRRDCRAIVDETLHHFDGQRLVLISFVVMPNHVHVLFVQNAEWPLEKIIRSWKSFPARRINERLERSAIFGSAIILTGWCVIKNISQNVFDTYGAIRRRPGCAKESIFSTRAIWREPLNEKKSRLFKEGRFPIRPFEVSAVWRPPLHWAFASLRSLALGRSPRDRA